MGRLPGSSLEKIIQPLNMMSYNLNSIVERLSAGCEPERLKAKSKTLIEKWYLIYQSWSERWPCRKGEMEHVSAQRLKRYNYYWVMVSCLKRYEEKSSLFPEPESEVQRLASIQWIHNGKISESQRSVRWAMDTVNDLRVFTIHSRIWTRKLVVNVLSTCESNAYLLCR